MLSLLCSLYQYVGYIPENRPEVFEQCSELLFQRWDKVKRVPIPLRLGVRSRHLLEDLADFIFRNQAVQSGVQERQLRQMLTAQIRLGRTIEAEEAEDEAQAFLDYCAGRAWLLTQVSTVKGQRMFGFTHRTFLEYFAGRRIARLAESPEELVQALGPIILGVSSEVVPQIALQEFDANSNFGGDSALRLLVFTSRTLTHRANENFLQFAAECLEFGLALPQTAADIIRTILIGFERRSGARQLGDALFRGGDQAYRVIRNLIREEPSKELLIGALRLAAWSPGRAEAVTADWASVFDEATDALRITDLEIWREDEYLATLWYTERRISASDVLAAHGPGATLAANAVPGLSFESDLIRALREGASSPDRDAYLADLELVCSALEEDEATASLYAWEAVATAAKDLNTSSCTGAELFLVLCAALGLTERTYAAAGGVQSRLAGVLGVTVEAMDSHRDYIINRRDYDRDDWARLEPIPAVIGSALHDWQLPASRVNAVLRWLNADRRFVS